ncbi:hypothetical protein [Alkalispirochaeta alkalica]|uniref:hypothetical protein n=1 Tax=Alkalispirochaeta alkalica TaxID=46356 RepID=UPI001C00E63A|nr:hypothetical protein [Alkalispirochaeta alkalica]
MFRSNIMHPEVLSAFQRIQGGAIDFHGTFLLVANDKEFPDGNFPPFPGVYIEFKNNKAFLQYLERQETAN